jgi:hypothetical protein
MIITIDTTQPLSEADKQALAVLAGGVTAKSTPAKAAAPKAEPTSDGGPTLEDAVAAATNLVANGGAAKVKEALASVEAKRVSELSEDKIQAFLDALNA